MLRLPLGLITGALAGNVTAWTHTLKRNALLYTLVGLFALTAYSLVIVALSLLLAQTQGVIAALFAVAGALALLCLVIIAVVAVMNRIDKRRRKREEAKNMLYATAIASSLPLVFRSGKLGIAAAALGGMALLYLTSGGGRHDDDDEIA